MALDANFTEIILEDKISETIKNEINNTATEIKKEVVEQKPESFDDFLKKSNPTTEPEFKKEEPKLNSEITGDLTEDDLKRLKISAAIDIEVYDTLLTSTCQIVMGDFSDVTNKRYGFNDAKRERLTNLLAEVKALDKKKRNPKGEFWKALIFSALPIIVLAVKDFFNKRKQKAEIQKTTNEIESLKQKIVSLEKEKKEALEKDQFTTIEVKQENGTVATLTTVKKDGETRGRHVKNCACEKCIKKRKEKNKSISLGSQFEEIKID